MEAMNATDTAAMQKQSWRPCFSLHSIKPGETCLFR